MLITKGVDPSLATSVIITVCICSWTDKDSRSGTTGCYNSCSRITGSSDSGLEQHK